MIKAMGLVGWYVSKRGARVHTQQRSFTYRLSLEEMSCLPTKQSGWKSRKAIGRDRRRQRPFTIGFSYDFHYLGIVQHRISKRKLCREQVQCLRLHSRKTVI